MESGSLGSASDSQQVASLANDTHQQAMDMPQRTADQQSQPNHTAADLDSLSVGVTTIQAGSDQSEDSTSVTSSPGTSPRLPPVPTSSYQFQADCRTLKDSPERFYTYFKVSVKVKLLK